MQLSESEDTASTQSADEDKYPENQQEPSPLTIRIGNTFTLANATEEEADNDLIDMMPFRKQALNGDDTESKDEYGVYDLLLLFSLNLLFSHFIFSSKACFFLFLELA